MNIDHIPKKQSRVERKKADARERILSAASDQIFLGKGYEKTTIRDIAKEADVSIGAVYLHFSGKPEIMTVLLQRHFLMITEKVEKRLAIEQTGIGKISGLIEFFINFSPEKEFSTFLKAMMDISPDNIEGQILQSIGLQIWHFTERVAGIIELGVVDGTIEPVEDATMTAFIFIHMMQSFVREIVHINLNSLAVLHHHFTLDSILLRFKSMLLSVVAKR